MDEVQVARLNTCDSSENSPRGVPNLSWLNLYNSITKFPKNVQECVEFHLKPWKRGQYPTKLEFFGGDHRESSSARELSLEKQLRPWRENPTWVEHPPDIKVTVPKGSLCNLNLEVNVGLPPEAVYNIVTDPDNKRVFKNIKEVISRKVLVDEGLRQVVEVEQAAIWRFLWWSGTISVHVLVDQNKEDYTMRFKQIKSGFMKKFEGCWKLEPIFVDQDLCDPLKPTTMTDYVLCSKGRGRIASRLSLQQLIQPSVIPPPPISWYVRGITTKTTEMLISDLLAEAARIRQDSSSETLQISEETPDEFQVRDACNIKERWALRRKKARNYRRRL